MTGRKWLGSVAMLLVGAGLAWGQVPPSDRPHPADAARAPSVQQPAEFVPPPAVDSSPVPGAPADCGNPACGSFFLCGRDADQQHRHRAEPFAPCHGYSLKQTADSR